METRSAEAELSRVGDFHSAGGQVPNHLIGGFANFRVFFTDEVIQILEDAFGGGAAQVGQGGFALLLCSVFEGGQ